MYKLIIMLCLTGTPCIKVEHKKRIYEENSFKTVEHCKEYADNFYIEKIYDKYRPKWKLLGALCIREDLDNQREV